jgi:choline kinase
MRAIILAAGRGVRLQQAEDQQLPKCLLQFGGMSLLERHLRLLKKAGVHDVVLALGVRHDLVASELDRLGWQPRPAIVLNDRFELGSVVTVHTVAEAMTRRGEVLLRDADVLYHERILTALLVAGKKPANRVLIDRNFVPGDEPVKKSSTQPVSAWSSGRITWCARQRAPCRASPRKSTRARPW